ncbi:Stimulated By Retinoic Acid 8 Protein-like [Manis pentadactyla]|nr:Stimulated By Retinoic Acid 8 Protein-like [Manis pentadactyla]
MHHQMLLPVISVCISTIWAKLSPDQVSLPAELFTSAERAEIIHEAPVQVAGGPGTRAEANKSHAPGTGMDCLPRRWTRHLSDSPSCMLPALGSMKTTGN